MAADSAIADRILTALAEYLKRDKRSIGTDYSLRDDLGLDSMATIELLFKIEEAFDLQIPDQDLQGLVTVGDVIGYVERRLKPAVSAKQAAKSPVKRSRTRK
jgi:acyl carrier protein